MPFYILLNTLDLAKLQQHHPFAANSFNLAIKFISWKLKLKGIDNIEIVIRDDGHTVYKRNKKKEESIKNILAKIK